MSYTFTKKATPPLSGRYANQPIDGARIAIQGIGNGIQTTDASGTAVTSPVTLSSTATTLNTPDDAVTVTIKNSGATNSMTISEVSGSASAYTLLTGESVTLDCGDMGKLYLVSSSGTSCDFFYTIV